MGLIVPMLDLSPSFIIAVEVLSWFGTWFNGLAFVASGYDGVISPLAGSMSKTAPPPNGISERSLNHMMLMITGPTVIAALVLELYGMRNLVLVGKGRIDKEAEKQS